MFCITVTDRCAFAHLFNSYDTILYNCMCNGLMAIFYKNLRFPSFSFPTTTALNILLVLFKPLHIVLDSTAPGESH